MRFPPSFIERLRSHFLISEVIGRRISIKKHGREYQALCPFHNEKTPSFTINDDKGFYHCFGCGAHGDAIEFIRRHERLSYPETIERLANEAGIPLPKISAEETRRAEIEQTLYGVLEAAAQWFERQLAASGGAAARDYLDRRGLTAQTQRNFRIGYAPEARTGLFSHLQAAGFPQSLQAEAGLIIVPEDGAPYDRFRGRVMFPIRNPSGKVVAFGGRLIAESTAAKPPPKYLNSPETPLFKKGEMLYNLDLARRPAREGNIAVVMEGYVDVVSTVQAGIAYAVATLGTAVTPSHLHLLWQLAREPVMCLDGDAAGKRAMMRAAEVALPLLKPGYSLRFALLPAGEDPDSYVQKFGKPSFEKILLNARRLSQVLWETLSAGRKLDVPEDRAALDNELKKLAERITDPTTRAHYASYFRRQLWPKTEGRFAEIRSPQVERLGLQEHSAALDALVRSLLALLMHCPALLHRSQVEEALSRLEISHARLDALRQAMLSAHMQENMDNRERFAEYLERQLHGELPAGVSLALKLPYRDALSDEDAARLWQETLEAYDSEIETRAIEERLQRDWNEHDQARLSELKKKQAARLAVLTETDAA